MTEQTESKRGFLGASGNLLIAGVVVGVILVALVVGLVVTGQPGFWRRYPAYSRSYSTLATSAHKGMACSACHSEARGVGYRLVSSARNG